MHCGEIDSRCCLNYRSSHHSKDTCSMYERISMSVDLVWGKQESKSKFVHLLEVNERAKITSVSLEPAKHLHLQTSSNVYRAVTHALASGHSKSLTIIVALLVISITVIARTYFCWKFGSFS